MLTVINSQVYSDFGGTWGCSAKESLPKLKTSVFSGDVQVPQNAKDHINNNKSLYFASRKLEIVNNYLHNIGWDSVTALKILMKFCSLYRFR